MSLTLQKKNKPKELLKFIFFFSILVPTLGCSNESETNIEATKITNDWYLWIHHTVNEIPKNTKKFDWEKKHSQNLTGTADAYKPNRIKYFLLRRLQEFT